MLTSPSVHVSLRRFGAWRGAAAVLTLVGVAAQLAWATAHGAAGRPALFALGAVIGVSVLCLGALLMRVDPVALRWDGRAWHLGPIGIDGFDGIDGVDGVEGRIAVAIDLGPWMLLRFMPTAPAARRHAAWLPAQRRGLEAEWHAFRCAVHAPRAHLAAPAARGL